MTVVKKIIVSLLVVGFLTAFFILENYIFNPYKEKINDGRISLTVAVFPSLDKAYEAMIPEFEKMNPGIKVTIRTLGVPDHHNMLLTTMAAGMGAPDVAAIEVDYVGQLCGGGGFDNLLEEPYNAGKYEKEFVSYKWTQASTDKKHVYAMPVDIAPACIYYRKDVLDKYNVQINAIKTMEDVYNLGALVTKDTDGDGKVDQWLVPGVDYIFKMIFFSSPSRFFDREGKANLKTPLIKKAIYWSKKIRDAGMDAKVEDWSNEWYTVIREGKVAYFPMGSWLNAHLADWIAKNQMGKFRVAELPALEKGEKPMTVSWGGAFLGIPKQCKNKEAAWKFIQYAVTRRESQLLAFEKAQSFPSMKSVWNDRVFSQPDTYLGNQEAARLWISIAQRIPDVYTDERDNIALSILMGAFTEVMDNMKTIDDALDDAQKVLENRLLIH